MANIQDNKDSHSVYKITVDKKVVYVGKTKCTLKERLLNHLRSHPILKEINTKIKDVKIIAIESNLSYAQAWEREVFYINVYSKKNKQLFNKKSKAQIITYEKSKKLQHYKGKVIEKRDDGYYVDSIRIGYDIYEVKKTIENATTLQK